MIQGHAVLDFEDSLADLIELFEGWSPTAYFNAGDVPTIGYGVTFVYKVSDTDYDARLVAELNDWFSGIYTFTVAEQETLADIATELNQGNQAAAMQLFNGWGPATMLSLTEHQGETVLHRAVVDVTAGAIPADIATGVGSLANTRELTVLYSLAYNAPELVGPNLEAAIRNDDRASAWYEIRYQSNGGDPAFQDGIAKRRYAESQIFGLYDDEAKVTETDARETFRMFTAHEDIIRDYDAKYGA